MTFAWKIAILSAINVAAFIIIDVILYKRWRHDAEEGRGLEKQHVNRVTLSVLNIYAILLILVIGSVLEKLLYVDYYLFMSQALLVLILVGINISRFVQVR